MCVRVCVSGCFFLPHRERVLRCSTGSRHSRVTTMFSRRKEQLEAAAAAANLDSNVGLSRANVGAFIMIERILGPIILYL